MPVVNQDDVKMLDILISATDVPEEKKEELKTHMGIDDEDIKMWGIATSSKPAQGITPEIQEELKVKVLDKIRTQKDVVKDPMISGEMKALAAGGIQGLTLDWGDEIAAGLTAGFEKIKNNKDFMETYEKEVKSNRAELKRLENKYPVQFIGGELAGALILPVPGSALRGGKVATKLINKFGMLAVESAIQSAGASEADYLSKQFIEDVSKGTAFGIAGGALLGKAAKKTGEFIKKGISPTKRAAQVVSSVLFDLPPAYTERLLDARTANKILNPKSSQDIADSVVSLTKNMGEHAKALSLIAQEKLSKKNDIDVTEIVDLIAQMPNVKRVIKGSMSEAVAAQKAGSKAVEDLASRATQKGLISEYKLKQFIQDLDDEISWNPLEWKKKDKILSEIRTVIDQQVLKQNKEYAKAMIPVSNIMRNLKDISKSFSLKRKGYETVASDQTHSKINGFFNVAGLPKKLETEKALKQAESRYLGPDKPEILEDIEISAIARRTEGGLPAGSKHILTGVVAGSLVGSPLWGAIAGAVKDRYGRKIGKTLIPKLSSSIEATDKIIQNVTGKVSPEVLEALSRTSGRYMGVETGVEASQQPKSLFQPRLIPQR